MRSRLTYANVVSSIALFAVVAGGGAYAASKIGTSDIQRGAVTSEKLRKEAVTAAKLAPNALDGPSLTAASGVALAGAEIDSHGAVVSWFNRMGGPPEVGHPIVGEWTLDFPGVSGRTGPFVGAVNVTGPSGGVIGIPGIATTRMSGTCSGTCANRPLINTFTPDGTETDLGFNYVMYGSASLAP